MAICYKEIAILGRLNSVLHPRWNEEINFRRIGEGERTNVGDNSKVARAVYTIDANDIAASDIRADKRNQGVSCLANECHVPWTTQSRNDRAWQSAGECGDIACLWINA